MVEEFGLVFWFLVFTVKVAVFRGFLGDVYSGKRIRFGTVKVL